MLGWALTFLVIALIAAVLGFGGIAGFAVEIAKIIFFVAIILFVISAVFALISAAVRRRFLNVSSASFSGARVLSPEFLTGRELVACVESISGSERDG
jgi:uncharacterized membrane protein YtjA (UPF0391 family)